MRKKKFEDRKNLNQEKVKKSKIEQFLILTKTTAIKNKIDEVKMNLKAS